MNCVPRHWLHSTYGKIIHHVATQNGYHCLFEQTIGNKNFDLLLSNKQGEKIGVEICLTGSPSRTTEQLLRGRQQQEITQLWAVFEKDQFLRSTQKELKKNHKTSDEQKVLFKAIADFVENYLKRSEK